MISYIWSFNVNRKSLSSLITNSSDHAINTRHCTTELSKGLLIGVISAKTSFKTFDSRHRCSQAGVHQSKYFSYLQFSSQFPVSGSCRNPQIVTLMEAQRNLMLDANNRGSAKLSAATNMKVLTWNSESEYLAGLNIERYQLESNF